MLARGHRAHVQQLCGTHDMVYSLVYIDGRISEPRVTCFSLCAHVENPNRCFIHLNVRNGAVKVTLYIVPILVCFTHHRLFAAGVSAETSTGSGPSDPSGRRGYGESYANKRAAGVGGDHLRRRDGVARTSQGHRSEGGEEEPKESYQTRHKH